MISKKLQKQFDSISDILTKVGERVEGNLVCDVSPDNIVIDKNKDKIYNLQYLAKEKQRICEIGVNAGHSLLIMLEQNQSAEYILFDLGNHKYTKPCIEYIKEQYPKTRIKIIYGDSKETIPNFILRNEYLQQSFDLVHIDGGHGFLEFCSDFYNCRYLVNNKSLTIFDDYNYPDINKFINQRLDVGSIKRYQNSNLKNTNKHIVYTY